MRRRSALATLCAGGLCALGMAGCATAHGTPAGNHAPITIAINGDPGTINPLTNVTAPGEALVALSYDTLVFQAASGAIQGELATKWTVTPTKAVFSIRHGITCSDGSALTPSVIAETYTWALNAKNHSPFLGIYITPGTKVTASNSAGTLTFVAPQPSSFFLRTLADMPIACSAAFPNTAQLNSKTLGSGPYVLSSSTPGEQYTFTLRKGYEWGPGGVTSSTSGLPKTIVAKVVPSESTAANLLISGQLNLAAITGSDRNRLEGHGFDALTVETNPELIFYNQAKGRPGSDLAVREALTMALNRSELASVATDGHGQALTNLESTDPSVCKASTPLASALPAGNLATARRLLGTAGWTRSGSGPLAKSGKTMTLHVIYTASEGVPLASAVQLMRQEWAALGVTVTTQAVSESQLTGILFSGGNWDVAWVPIVAQIPSFWQGIVAGPTPPNGGDFSYNDNATYNKLSAAADGITGTASCADWHNAEVALVRSVDVVPISARTETIFGSHLTFSFANTEVATTSLRESGNG